MQRYDLFCRPVQVTGPRVVPHSFPGLQNRVEIGPGEGVNVGKANQELFVAFTDHRDSGLLGHDLGEPDPVRIRFCPPRDVAFA